MPLATVGALAAFGLTIQFAATLALFAVVLPARGLDGLAEALADYIAAHAAATVPFMLLNLYNASFAVTALLLVLATAERLAEARTRMTLAVIAASIAAAFFLAVGIVPIVGAPPLVAANDTAALRAMIWILTGLTLAATSAAGVALALSGWAGLTTGLLPRGLCCLLLAAGVVEIAEFAVPPFLVLDPLLGVLWSAWAGIVYWRAGRDGRGPAPRPGLGAAYRDTAERP